MDLPNSISYKDAGVDIDAKMQAIDRLKARAQSTLGASAGPIGHFGGTWQLSGPANQILVASADGVGTKLRIAFTLGGDAHATVGADIVSHCVNDILALGATPLFFLDYFATGRLDLDTVEAVVGGIADACALNNVALLGGETAEMPDMYAEGEYDLAGFIIGSVTEDRIVDGSGIRESDVVIGLPSTGLHTNGYSLARKAVGMSGNPEHDRQVLTAPLAGTGISLGEALIAGHRSYLPEVMPLLDAGLVRGMAHITGGGLVDNLPRTLPEECIAVLDPRSWSVPPVLDYVVEQAGMSDMERYRVFNMGIGFVLVVRPDNAVPVLQQVPDALPIGRIIARRTPDESPVQGLLGECHGDD
jgi:phosphoribosylformylglycinamidine cyclo-ligase